jgi:hypothetical protein
MPWALCGLALALAVAGGVCAAEPGLVGWWNFDEGPGPTAADATGNGNAGTLTGGVQWMAQETGGALEFDGSSGYLRIPFSDSLRVLNKSNLTIMAWFKADAIPTENKEVFQQGDANGTGRTWLYITATAGQIQTYLGGSATASGVNVTAGTWFHAAVVITEAEREWATPQNWTVEGADTLHLFVRGNATNGPGNLYVAVEDSSGKAASATNPNPNIVRVGVWTEWKISLSSFMGVNLAKVKKLYIGVGDRKTPVAGGSGRIYVDDVRVTKP